MHFERPPKGANPERRLEARLTTNRSSRCEPATRTPSPALNPGALLLLLLLLLFTVPGCGESRAVDAPEAEAAPKPPPAMALAMDQLASKDRGERSQGADTLRAVGDEARPWLREFATITTNESTARALAVRLLGELDPPAVDLLCDLLRDRSAKVAAAALESLDGLGEVAIPCLAGELAHGDAQHRTRAALLVAKAGPFGIPALLDTAANDADPETLRAVCEALRRIEGIEAHAETVLPTALRAFASEEPRLQRSASGALAELGDAGRDALASLIAEAPGFGDERSPTIDAARRAAVALARDDEAGRTRLLALAISERPSTRAIALTGLGSADLFDDQVCSALVDALQDPETEVHRAAAAEIRRNAGVALKPSLPALFDALSHPDDNVAETILEALVEVGPAVGGRVIKYLQVDRDERGLLKLISIAARVPTSTHDATPSLEALSSSDSDRVRVAAAAAIERIRNRRKR